MIRFLFFLCCLFIITACSDSKVSKTENSKSDEIVDDDFVQVNGGRFQVGGKDYAFVGANMWYGAYLGSKAADIGDRARLIKELDQLSQLGVKNLRVLGISELSPLRDSISPAVVDKNTLIREDVLEGLDFLLAQMAKRDMKAVIYVNNFWEWSGGMATYLSWVNGGNIVDPSDPAKPWPAFALFAAQFYKNEEAKEIFNTNVKRIVSRKNTITGEYYRDDPTIMSWQLANEPRPGHQDHSMDNLSAYYKWIGDTAKLIKSLSPKHLVSVGSEGTMGCLVMEECVVNSHKDNDIDYMTFHMWLKNWGWFNVKEPESTYSHAIARAENYISQHIKLAKKLEMPLVLEEFGLERDMGEFSPLSSVNYRDKYFSFVFSKVEESVVNGGPLVGTNFWAWGGYGKASHEDAVWRSGDKFFVGDPPQEPQGLNSVFSSDESTLFILNGHAKRISGEARDTLSIH